MRLILLALLVEWMFLGIDSCSRVVIKASGFMLNGDVRTHR